MKHLAARWADAADVEANFRRVLHDVLGQTRVSCLGSDTADHAREELRDIGVATVAGVAVEHLTPLVAVYAAEVAYILTTLDVVRDGSAPETEGLGVRLTGCES